MYNVTHPHPGENTSTINDNNMYVNEAADYFVNEYISVLYHLVSPKSNHCIHSVLKRPEGVL